MHTRLSHVFPFHLPLTTEFDIFSVKEAAIILGYDKEHWDQGLEIEVGVDWNELSEEKKAAAFKIGYEEGDWNALTPQP